MPSSSRCSTLYGVDVFIHDDFEVTLLEGNALPTQTGGNFWLDSTLHNYGRLLGMVPTNRTAYADRFRRVVCSCAVVMNAPHPL